MKRVLLTLSAAILFLSQSMAQQTNSITEPAKKEKSTQIQLKDGAKPLVIIDGKEYDPEILDLIDQDKIAKMEVFKGEEAMKRFNAESAIVITSNSKNVIRIMDGNTIKIEKKDMVSETSDPVIIIDGNVSDKETLSNLSPDDIHSVSVLKDEKAMAKYNTKAGVIIIKTKPKKEPR